MKITRCDPLHHEYLTINLGNFNDWEQVQLPLVRLCEILRGRSWTTGADCGRSRDPGAFSHSLSHSPSQDGLSLEFVTATVGRKCNIQDVRGGGLWGGTIWRYYIKDWGPLNQVKLIQRTNPQFELLSHIVYFKYSIGDIISNWVFFSVSPLLSLPLSRHMLH